MQFLVRRKVYACNIRKDIFSPHSTPPHNPSSWGKNSDNAFFLEKGTSFAISCSAAQSMKGSILLANGADGKFFAFLWEKFFPLSLFGWEEGWMCVWEEGKFPNFSRIYVRHESWNFSWFFEPTRIWLPFSQVRLIHSKKKFKTMKKKPFGESRLHPFSG